MQYGRFNDIRAQAAVDLPIGNLLRVRVAAFHQVNDGYGPKFAARRFDKADLSAVRVTTIFDPAPNLSWRLSGSYARNTGTVSSVFLRNYNVFPEADLVAGTFGPVTIVPSDAINPGLDTVASNRQDITSYDLRSRLTLSATDNLSLTYLAGYSLLKNDGVTAATGYSRRNTSITARRHGRMKST